MEASELRIGNSIMQDDNFVFVTWWRLELMENNKIEYKPIPLTEEWLLKFGFEFENKKFIKSSLCIREYQYGSGLTIFLSNENFNFNVELKYVHQLQNLYHALTREELTLTDHEQ